MKKENLSKAKKLTETQYNLKILQIMTRSHFFRIAKKLKFEDGWSVINFNELDDKTCLELKCVISDYCKRRIAEIDSEIEEL